MEVAEIPSTAIMATVDCYHPAFVSDLASTINLSTGYSTMQFLGCRGTWGTQQCINIYKVTTLS